MLREATRPGDMDTVRRLFREYAQAVNAPACFAGFERELIGLPAGYAAILLAEVQGSAAGCLALRLLNGMTAEMKRLYVRRGQGIGRLLAEAGIDIARRQGRRRIVLDTLPTMSAAIALYRQFGFRETAPYLAEPTPGAICFELSLGRRGCARGAVS